MMEKVVYMSHFNPLMCIAHFQHVADRLVAIEATQVNIREWKLSARTARRRTNDGSSILSRYVVRNIAPPDKMDFRQLLFYRYCRERGIADAESIYQKHHERINRTILNLPEHSFISFSLAALIFQQIIQSNLNAKHGVGNRVKNTNYIIFKENKKEFQCIFVTDRMLPEDDSDDDDDDGDDDETFLRNNSSYLAFETSQRKYYYLFATRDTNTKKRFIAMNELEWYCTSYRTFFRGNVDQYIINFVRLFYFEYTHKLNIENDILLLFLFIVAKLYAQVYNYSFNMHSLCTATNNPIVALSSGGSIHKFRSFRIEEADEEADEADEAAGKRLKTNDGRPKKLYNLNGPIINRMLSIPSFVGNLQKYIIEFS